jgi:hypothetical protein
MTKLTVALHNFVNAPIQTIRPIKEKREASPKPTLCNIPYQQVTCRRIGAACGTFWVETQTGFCLYFDMRREHFECLSVDGKIILQ